jgi:hypothetical protein
VASPDAPIKTIVRGANSAFDKLAPTFGSAFTGLFTSIPLSLIVFFFLFTMLGRH